MAKLLGHDLITITELNAALQQMNLNVAAVQTRLDKFRKYCLIGGIINVLFMLSALGIWLFKL